MGRLLKHILPYYWPILVKFGVRAAQSPALLAADGVVAL